MGFLCLHSCGTTNIRCLHFQLSSFSFDLLSSYLSLLLICRNNSLASSQWYASCLKREDPSIKYWICHTKYYCNICNYMRGTNNNSGTHSYIEGSTNVYFLVNVPPFMYRISLLTLWRQPIAQDNVHTEVLKWNKRFNLFSWSYT